MKLFDQEHCELIAMFEREPAYKGLRLDKEPKTMWSKEHIYQNGETNQLFLAYRRGYAFRKAVAS